MSITLSHRFAILSRLEATLVAAQSFRKELDKIIGNEPEWVVFERESMLEATNAELAKLEKPPVTVQKIMEGERNACGHFDYTHKFALYCTFLVEGIDWRE